MNPAFSETATSLYRCPHASMRAMSVLVVVSAGVPGWLIDFVRLAARSDCFAVSILQLKETLLPTVRKAAPDLRAILAFEESRRGRGAVFGEAEVGAAPMPELLPVLEPGADGKALVARVSGLRPDLVLLAADPRWLATLSGLAPLGCWNLDGSLRQGELATTALLPALLAGEAATPIGLEIEYDDGQTVPLATGTTATYRATLIGHRERSCLKLPSLLLRGVLRQLHGDPALRRGCAATLRLAGSERTRGWLEGARAMAGALAYRAADRLRRSRLRDDDWSVVLRRDRDPLDPGDPSISQPLALQAPPGRYWADPCAVSTGEGDYLFVEECSLGLFDGSIVCLRIADDGHAHRLGEALREDVHLSFPQVFTWGGHWYMTVESGRDHRVTLYRSDAFPFAWTRVADLLAGWPCVDPVLHFHDNHWYLFASVVEAGAGSCDSLFLFVSDVLEGPYRPHPCNPLVDDVRRARMAGRLLRDGERLVRPAQDCAASYGAAVVFNEVEVLGPEHYRERPIGRLDPLVAGLGDGCHTYSRSARIEAVDVRSACGITADTRNDGSLHAPGGGRVSIAP